MTKYNRSEYIMKEVVDGITECDFVRSSINNFEFKQKTKPFYVSDVYAKRPDLIALDYYGDQQVWWIVMQFNGIEDIYNDLVSGLVLQMPAKSEMLEFITKSKKYIS